LLTLPDLPSSARGRDSFPLIAPARPILSAVYAHLLRFARFCGAERAGGQGISHRLSPSVLGRRDELDSIIARALLMLAGNGNQRKRHRFAGISQGTLATMIGTTRSRVNFFMNKFRVLGFIKYRGPLDANGGLHINTSRLAEAFCK